MNDDHEAEAHLRRIIGKTLRADEILLEKLTALVERFAGDRTLDKAEQEMIKAAYKQIAMVVDFENQLHKHGAARSAGDGAALDLDAARAEIAGRLDRLWAARAADGAD